MGKHSAEEAAMPDGAQQAKLKFLSESVPT